MATITFKRGDEYLAKIARLQAKAREEVVGPAIYAAAEIVADEMRQQLEQVPTGEGWATAQSPKAGPQQYQKEALLRSLGVTSMSDDGAGFLNVKIGFDGYNEQRTQRWPQGQPNQMVARSVERGTYFMQANPFVKRTIARVSKRARETLGEKVDENIEKIMKG